MSMNICLLVSGKLGLSILAEVFKVYNIKCVLTDKNSEEIVTFCTQNDIVFYAGNPRNGKVSELINTISVDIILSVNYLFLIDKEIINWPGKYAINIHGSLLPKYRGRTPHVWAIINNEKETGITAHLIDDGCDTGPIIKQTKIKIEEQDTGATILEKYQQLYPELVNEVLESVSNETIVFEPQDDLKATYFSKRSPEDGQINWDWQKERINNWVRAMANPYPGAFAFYADKKVTINKIEFSEFGFTDSIQNGTILNIESGYPIVKTQNGAIKVLDFNPELIFNVNDKFYGKY